MYSREEGEFINSVGESTTFEWGWLVQFGGGQIPSRLAAANQIKYNRNNIAPEIPVALCIVANKITNNERGGGLNFGIKGVGSRGSGV